MAKESAPLRQVDWQELFPWLTIFRSFRVALDPKKIVLAAAALFLTWAGWWGLALTFSGSESVKKSSTYVRLDQGNWPWGASTTLSPSGAWNDFLESTWSALSNPFRELFTSQVTLAQFTFVLLCGLWALAIWSILGGMIARMAAVELATEETVSMSEAFEHARFKWLDYFTGPVIPLGGVLFFAVLLAGLGLLLRFGVGVLAAAIVWPLALLAGLLMAVLLIGLLFGWPLMWATIAVEGGDSFESLSRSYGYLFQRPLKYLFYTLIASLLGALTWAIVMELAALTVSLSLWGASWGAGSEAMGNVIATTAPAVDPEAPLARPAVSVVEQMGSSLGHYQGTEKLGGLGYAGARVLAFWVGCVQLLALGYGFSFFWTAAVSIYFVLRLEIDGAELDEVEREDDGDEHGLPPLGGTAAGSAASVSLPIVTPGPTNELKPAETPPAPAASESAPPSPS